MDAIVVGREHGLRSASALAKLAEWYKPDLIIHEHSATSEQARHYATVALNGLMFDIRAVVEDPSKHSLDETEALYTQDYLNSVPNPKTNDEFLLVKLIRQAAPSKRPIIRLMGEAEEGLRSLTGQGLQDAYQATEDKAGLLEAEARIIIERESRMMVDVSRIIGNVRRKLPMEKRPRLNTMIVSGYFHAGFLHQQVGQLGISPAGVAGRIALDDKLYNLTTAKVASVFSADRLLKERVASLRG